MIGQLADVVLVHMATLVAVNRQTLLIYRNKYFHEKTVIYREGITGTIPTSKRYIWSGSGFSSPVYSRGDVRFQSFPKQRTNRLKSCHWA